MRPPNIADLSLLSHCGLNCLVCYAYLRSKKPCSGCLTIDINKPKHCVGCSIKKCATDKGLIYCYQCSIFPCKRMKDLIKRYELKYHVSIRNNFNCVKEKGLSYFMKEEIKSWTCKNCGGLISMHSRLCSECSNPI